MADTSPRPPSRYTYPRSLQRDVADTIASELARAAEADRVGMLRLTYAIAETFAEYSLEHFDIDGWLFRCRTHHYDPIGDDRPCPIPH